MKTRQLHHYYSMPLLFAGLALTACSASPIQPRLDKNFVYNCSLELIRKDVAPADAERICAASHRGELEEQAANREGPPPYLRRKAATPAPARTPASIPEPPPETSLYTPANEK